MTHAVIRIDFHDYWLAGDGRGNGGAADVRTIRDDDGWPALNMTQVKGILRETASQLVAAGALDRGNAAHLLGAEDRSAALSFDGQATVPVASRGQDGPGKFFHAIAAAAHTELGVARNRALRTVEAVAPVPLEGIVEGPDDGAWIDDLDRICAATTAISRDKGNFGATTVRCLKAVVADTDAPDDARAATLGGTPTARLMVDLLGSGDVRFTDRPATEGVRGTLDHIPGGALLDSRRRAAGGLRAPLHAVR